MEKENVIISEELYTKIKSTLKSIKVISQEAEIIKVVGDLLSELEKDNLETTSSLAERIRQKMAEVKNIDADIHTNLYIIYRKLMDNKISEEEALAAFEMYDVTYYPKDNSSIYLL